MFRHFVVLSYSCKYTHSMIVTCWRGY